MTKIKYLTTSTLSAVFLRAIFFSVVILSPFLVSHLRSEGLSPLLYRHQDELVYLKLPKLVYSNWSRLSFYAEHDREASAFEHKLHPNEKVDYLVGWLSQKLSLSTGELGLALDFFCVIAGYLALLALFRALAFDRLAAELAAMVALAFPLAFWPERYFYFPFAWGNLVNFPHTEFAALPILRGIYTQLSIPFFFLSLAFLAIWMKPDRKKSTWWLVLSAVVTGSQFYVYTFSWLTSSLLSLILIAAYFVTLCEQKEIRNVFKSTILYTLVNAVVCLKGVLALLSNQSPAAMKLSGLSEYFYLSPLSLFLCLILGVVTSLITNNAKRIFLWLVATILASQILPNLQALSGHYLTPSHFHRFYLGPLFSGLVLAGLVGYGSFFVGKWIRGGYVRWLRFACGAMVIMGVSALSFFNLRQQSFAWNKSLVYRGIHLSDFMEVSKVVKRTLSEDAVIAASPFGRIDPENLEIEGDFAPLESYIFALTDRKVLFQNARVTPDLVLDEVIEREFLLNFLYTGKVELIGACPSQVELPGDLFTANATIHKMLRQKICARALDLTQHTKECDLLKRYKVDYVLRQRPLYVPEVLNEFNEIAWRHDSNHYVLYKFKQDLAKRHFCQIEL